MAIFMLFFIGDTFFLRFVLFSLSLSYPVNLKTNKKRKKNLIKGNEALPGKNAFPVSPPVCYAKIEEHAPGVYPAESGNKMVELSIRKGNTYAYRHETDRIFVNLRDYYWHREEIYLLALMDLKHVGWGQLGYAWYVGLMLDPYSEEATIDYDPQTQAELLGYLRICANAGMRFENRTCADMRIQGDAVSRYCIEKGLTGWGTAYESMPLATTRLCKEPTQEDTSMSVYMAASFVAWLDDMYGFEAVSEYCFGRKTFDEAFGTDFAAAFAAWKAWIVETYPMA